VHTSGLWQQFNSATQKRKDEAARRLQVLDTLHTLRKGGLSKIEAQQRAAEQSQTSFRTIHRWQKQVEGLDRADWLAALLPSHGGGAEQTECSSDAWRMFESDYLRLAQPSLKSCYDRLCLAAKENGWTVPSYRTLSRRIEEIPLPVRVLGRQGSEAASKMFPAQKRDRSVFHALEAVNVDGHKFDVFVKWPDGTIGRPMGIFWQDLHSGKMLSWRIDRSENRDALRLSFGDLVEEFGIPSYVYLDNGRANGSKWLTGGMTHRFRFKVKEEEPLGIFTQMLGPDGICWTTPYHGQAKPIERAFRDFCDRISKHPGLDGHYTGNSPVTKPEDYDPKRGVALDVFLKVVGDEVIQHNARLGRRSDVCAGIHSFDQVFQKSYEVSPIRKATEAQRQLWLLAAEEVSTSRQDGAIHFYGNRYWEHFLAQVAGAKLVVRFDPQHLHRGIHVYGADGKYLGLARCQQAVGFNDTEKAREHARLRNSFVKHQRQALDDERRLTAAEVARYIPSPAPPDDPESKVVRPFFSPAAETDHAIAKAAGQQLWQDQNLRTNIRAKLAEVKAERVPD
jgi:hypothetical protein